MEELNQIISFFKEVENSELQNNQDIDDFIKTISSKELGIIESIEVLFIEEVKKKKINETCFNILKVLRKIYNYDQECIILLRENEEFISSLFEFIQSSSSGKLCKEAVFLYDKIFFDYKYPKDVFDNKFISCLFDLLITVEHEEAMTSIINILLAVNFIETINSMGIFSISNTNKDKKLVLEFTNNEHINDALYTVIKSSNYNISALYEDKITIANTIVSDYFAKNRNSNNSRLFLECLLRVINNISTSREVSLFGVLCYLNLSLLMKSSLLYTSDLESFFDYLLKRVESTESDMVRYYILTTLFVIEKFSINFKYKKDNLVSLMELFNDTSSIEEDMKEICTYIQLILVVE